MVKIQITKSGIYDQDENPIPVGTMLELPKDPAGWVNKYRVLASDEGKTLEAATPESTPTPTIEEEFEQEDKPSPAKRRGRPRKESGGKDDA